MSEYIEKIENNGVSVYGLGMLVNSAIVLAEHGYFVKGLDVDSNKISSLEYLILMKKIRFKIKI